MTGSDIHIAQVHGKGRKKTPKDVERARALLRQLREDCDRASPLKGLTREQVLERMRRTREELWREAHAAGPR